MRIWIRNKILCKISFYYPIKERILRLFKFTDLPVVTEYIPRGIKSGTHISAFTFGNTGDALLPVVIRDLFNQSIGVKRWHGKHVYELVTSETVNQYNCDDFILIGGGGLFLKDTNPNENSGWQWNCTIDALKKIKKPLIAFAIGYNRFRGQEDFNPIFRTFINEFVNKAQFIGLRNHGSIEKLKGYLETDEQKEKVVFQPCITTMICKLYPKLRNYESKDDYVAFNCAFDRQNLRSSNESILESIAKIALEMSKITKIKYFSHMNSDKKVLCYFDRYNVPYEVVEFSDIKQIITYYSTARLVVGMRGHAQMIPFGCLTPIVSIISHDKMQWFLDDIKHPDWGVDVMDVNFECKLLNIVIDAYNNYQERICLIKKAQNDFWEITQKNMVKIKGII